MTWLLMAAAMTAVLAAPVPGIIDIRRGRYQPVVVTWVIWAVLTGEGGWASLAAGKLPSAMYTFGCAAGCAVVAVLGLRVPTAQREPPVRAWGLRLDWICGAGSAAGLVMLTAARNPVTALIVTVATDFVAYLPTLVRASAGEPWLSYVLYAAGAAGTLTLTDWGTPTSWLYPLYMLATATAMTMLISGQRRTRTILGSTSRTGPVAGGWPMGRRASHLTAPRTDGPARNPWPSA